VAAIVSLGRWLAAGAIGSAMGFVGLVTALHLLRPELDPIQQDLSLYAVGPFGGLMAAAFVAPGARALGRQRRCRHSGCRVPDLGGDPGDPDRLRRDRRVVDLLRRLRHGVAGHFMARLDWTS
jgi:hypothetical protein